ncbi:MAG: hypothetical protein B7X55_04255 [Rhodobacterales bacterium 34-62-10]|nr:MAG: hypothetical protein B7X55_04255 [Rhodobacterales bacterium 34-62-10]
MKEISRSEPHEPHPARLTPLRRALAWLKAGHLDLAMDLLQKLADAAPGDPQIGYALAVTHLRNGRATQALACFDSLLKTDPGHTGVLHGRGLCLHSLGDRPAAIDAFRQAVSADPLSWRAWQSIADITPYEDDRIHALEGAADALRVICQTEGAGRNALIAAAEALLNARKPGRAARLLESCAPEDGNDPALIRLFARSLYHQGRFADAFAKATRLLMTLPEPASQPPPAFEPGRATKVLIEIQSLLSQAGVTSFLAAGTLLGFHRSGGPLLHDRDIDIGVLRNPEGGPDIAGILRAHPEVLLPAISRPGDRYFGLIHRSVAIDIFLHDEEDHHLLCGVSSLPGDIQWRLRAFTLKTASYGGRDWTIPSEPELYLSQSYGPGWQTPDPGFASAISSPALYNTDPFARSYYAIIRACRARAGGDPSKASALLRQSPIPLPWPESGADLPPANARPSD